MGGQHSLRNRLSPTSVSLRRFSRSFLCPGFECLRVQAPRWIHRRLVDVCDRLVRRGEAMIVKATAQEDVNARDLLSRLT